MSHSRSDCRIYVGNLPPDIRTKDIQDLFYKFGKVTFVDLKNRRGPPFAFVEFEDPRYVTSFVLLNKFFDFINLLFDVVEMRTMPYTPEMATITTDTVYEWNFQEEEDLAVLEVAVAVVAKEVAVLVVHRHVDRNLEYSLQVSIN